MDLRNLVFAGEGPGAAWIAGRYRHDAGRRDAPGRAQESQRRDARRAQYPQVQMPSSLRAYSAEMRADSAGSPSVRSCSVTIHSGFCRSTAAVAALRST